MPKRLTEYEELLLRPADLAKRTKGVGYLRRSTGCLALGVTGPVLRAAGLPLGPAQDRCRTAATRRTTSTCRRRPTADCWGRYEVRVAEMRESLKIIEQAWTGCEPGPVMVADKKIAWPAQLAVGRGRAWATRSSTSRKIMGQSMESLIHHFKLVTEGFRVPPGQVYVGDRVARAASWACTWSPTAARGRYRVHFREPSFVNLQAIPAMAEGGLIADVIAGGASLDPVMGGCDR